MLNKQIIFAKVSSEFRPNMDDFYLMPTVYGLIVHDFRDVIMPNALVKVFRNIPFRILRLTFHRNAE